MELFSIPKCMKFDLVFVPWIGFEGLYIMLKKYLGMSKDNWTLLTLENKKV